MVGKGLRWCYNDGVTGVNANWVKVFHVADGDTVIITITHYLILDFLPASYTALDKNLTDHGILEALDYDVDKLILTVSNTAACTAHGVCRTYNQRIANFISKSNCRLYILYNGGLRNWLT